jgi:hypothetical protein
LPAIEVDVAAFFEVAELDFVMELLLDRDAQLALPDWTVALSQQECRVRPEQALCRFALI